MRFSMNQTSPKKKQLPKDVLEKNDHDLMECIFGKKIMKEIDKVVADRTKKDDTIK